GGHAGPAPEAANLDILRDQLAELEADVARGVLPRERYEQARADLERRVLEEAQGDPAPASAPQPASAWTAAALAAAIPIGALALYLAIGTPSALSPGAEPQHEMTRKRVEQMVARLAARLEKAPEDPEGWRVLGRAYAVLGRHPEAARAYARASRAQAERRLRAATCRASPNRSRSARRGSPWSSTRRCRKRAVRFPLPDSSPSRRSAARWLRRLPADC